MNPHRFERAILIGEAPKMVHLDRYRSNTQKAYIVHKGPVEWTSIYRCYKDQFTPGPLGFIDMMKWYGMRMKP
jgi:hypothetical protein